MTIERFEVPGLAQFSYMVEDSGEAIVIDPMRDITRYLDAAAAKGWKITHVVETHIHADYASGAKALAERTGTELAVSAHDGGERFQYSMPHRGLRDGDVIQVGKMQLKALHTPGHTPEHLSFVLYEQGSSEPIAIFTGDFLFVGALGRPDLLGEAESTRLAAELYRSVSERIAGLPDALRVYPGHGAGSLCGAGMSDRPESTLGDERATNPYFGYGEQEFVCRILDASPEMPSYYPRMKELNSVGAVAFESLPEMKTLVAEVSDTSATVIDLRRPEAFGEAHIPGALNIGLGGNIAMWTGWLLPPETDIIFVGETEEDCREARTALARVGLDRIAGYLRGGMAAWIAAGHSTAQTKQATAADIELATGAVILDVRNAAERAHGSIAGTQGIPLGELPAALQALSPEQEVIAVCGSGYRSSAAASLLQRAGFAHVSHLGSGMAGLESRSS